MGVCMELSPTVHAKKGLLGFLLESIQPRAIPKFVTFEGGHQTYCSGKEVRFDGGLDRATPIVATFHPLAVLPATMGRHRCGGRRRCSLHRGTHTYSHCLKYYPRCDFNWIFLFSKPYDSIGSDDIWLVGIRGHGDLVPHLNPTCFISPFGKCWWFFSMYHH
jgi:hypothetical protein